MKRYQIEARILYPSGEHRTINPIGRDAWALSELVKAGEAGCTPIDNPAPRWSGYIFKLRKVYGVNVATIEEKHGGQFSGTHARYRLIDDVQIVSETGGA